MRGHSNRRTAQLVISGRDATVHKQKQYLSPMQQMIVPNKSTYLAITVKKGVVILNCRGGGGGGGGAARFARYGGSNHNHPLRIAPRMGACADHQFGTNESGEARHRLDPCAFTYPAVLPRNVENSTLSLEVAHPGLMRPPAA